MSVSVTIHLSDGFTTEGQLNEFGARPCNLAWLNLRQSDVCIVSLMFDEPAQVDTLVAALVELRGDFAAARPDPAVVPLFEPELRKIETPIKQFSAATLEEVKQWAGPDTDELPIRLEPETAPKCPGCTNLLRTTEETVAGFCEECQAEHKKIAF